MGTGIASFIAGFGTGYLNADKQKKDRERQERIDLQNKEAHDLQMEVSRNKLDAMKEQDAQDIAVGDGLKTASSMREGVGLVGDGVQYDASEQGFAARLKANGVDDETAAATAPIYANQAKQNPGTWLNDSFGENTGKLHTTTKEDIHNAEADAFAAGGVRYTPQRMAALKDAATAKYGQAVKKIMAFDGQDFTPVREAYGAYQDGFDINGETGNDGKFYTYHLDGSGNKVGTRAYESPDAFKKSAVMHLVDPNNAQGYIANMMKWMDQEQGDRKLGIQERKISLDAANAEMREDRRDQRQARQIEASDARQSRSIEAIDRRQNTQGSKITPAQHSNNEEIVLARKRLDGMTQTDIQGKVAQYLRNGRDNPDYDPTLAAVWRTANQRKVGEDPQFDKFMGDAKPIKKGAAETQKQTPRQRFETDPAVSGMNMGKYTSKGWEVRDKSGNLAGYYQ